jgi:hypothetical protein
MFTSFILCNVDGEPIMINIQDISYVSGNQIFLRSRQDEETCITVDESFDVINDKLCQELNNDN